MLTYPDTRAMCFIRRGDLDDAETSLKRQRMPERSFPCLGRGKERLRPMHHLRHGTVCETELSPVAAASLSVLLFIRPGICDPTCRQHQKLSAEALPDTVNAAQ